MVKNETKYREKKQLPFVWGLIIFIIIPLATWGLILAVDLKTNDLALLWLAVFGISLGGFFLSAILKKLAGQQVTRSKRHFAEKILLLAVKSFIMAMSFIALVAAFLLPGQEMVFECEGIPVISIPYLINYIWIYIVVYVLMVVLTRLMVNPS